MLAASQNGNPPACDAARAGPAGSAVRSWWPTTAEPVPLLVQLLQVMSLSPPKARPSWKREHVALDRLLRELESAPRADQDEVLQRINRLVFPGTQGGPLEHVIAAKAVAFREAMQPEFREYGGRVDASVARNLPQAASLTHRDDLSPWLSRARTLYCHSRGSVRPAVLPRPCLLLPLPPAATSAGRRLRSRMPSC